MELSARSDSWAGETLEPPRPLPRILLAHNRYLEPGGEDAVVRSECELLRTSGHFVHEYVRDNRELLSRSAISMARGTIWAHDTYRSLRVLLERHRPDVAHFHNTFPLISPAAYEACWDARVPVVQTLHNYRLFCPAGTLFRDGHPCHDCHDHGLSRSVYHRCYRGSYAASATVAAMLAFHSWRRTWAKRVDCYVALTDFSRHKFMELGLPADKIVVKPNFVDPDPGMGEGRGGYALFVGRLCREKGIRTLLAGWRMLGGRVPLKIFGDGPDAPLVRDAASSLANVEWLGWRTGTEVLQAIGDASLLVFASEWYEACPRVLIESLARGTPVLAAGLGAAAELITAGRTGFHFRVGDPQDLAMQAERAVSDPARLGPLRSEARREYERKYTAASNYHRLSAIYESVLRASR